MPNASAADTERMIRQTDCTGFVRPAQCSDFYGDCVQDNPALPPAYRDLFLFIVLPAETMGRDADYWDELPAVTHFMEIARHGMVAYLDGLPAKAEQIMQGVAKEMGVTLAEAADLVATLKSMAETTEAQAMETASDDWRRLVNGKGGRGGSREH